MLFLVMGFISLVDEIQFMLISSRHICIRSMEQVILVFILFSYSNSNSYYNDRNNGMETEGSE